MWPLELLPTSFFPPYPHPVGKGRGENSRTRQLLIAGNLNLYYRCRRHLMTMWQLASALRHKSMSVKKLATFDIVPDLAHEPVSALIEQFQLPHLPCHSLAVNKGASLWGLKTGSTASPLLIYPQPTDLERIPFIPTSKQALLSPPHSSYIHWFVATHPLNTCIRNGIRTFLLTLLKGCQSRNSCSETIFPDYWTACWCLRLHISDSKPFFRAHSKSLMSILLAINLTVEKLRHRVIK